MSTLFHEPVLLHESLNLLITDRSGSYVDATVGGGGHSEGICRSTEGHARLICFDADEQALVIAKNRLAQQCSNTILVHSNFRNLKSELLSHGISAISGLLLDLGVSSHHLDEGTRGFSFRADEPIDMRMDRRGEMTGWRVVNEYEERALADVLWKYGEERASRRIARSIVAERPIETTGNLRAIIQAAVGERFLTKSLARVFQAIRIEVNGELESLKTVLKESIDVVRPGGRIVVISYHSLEDRIVKDFFRAESASVVRSGDKYLPDRQIVPHLKMLTKKPIVAGDEEQAQNPRSRSAKLRAAERIVE
ncbi:MAG: 16S rRNA (cytosine(1402)-N(4))-methyltransferase RsmH [Bacteroidota bacterium]